MGSITAEHDLATIAVVGDDMKHTPGIAGKLFGTLGRNGINVIACTQGASETNISVVVTLESLPKAINVIHDSFFLSEYQVLNIFVAGVGQVGRDLLEQIRLQRRTLMADNGLQIRVVGIANSRKRLIDAEGIALNDCLRRLEEEGTPSTPESLRDEILALNIYNSVFVDCTASAEVAALYRSLLDHNVSVVASNKIAASSDYALYRELKTVSRKRNAKFLFETNVGAGLPIINTISDLINSGDRILRIEAVVSGTLNYIFDRMSAEIPFSRAVRMAQEAGYAEPDPRVDLSGTDVIRKLVILTREAGYAVEQRDVGGAPSCPKAASRGASTSSGIACPKRTPASKHGGDGSKPKGNGCVSSPAWRTDAPRSGSKRSTTKARSTTFRAATTSSSSPPNATANTRSRSRGTAPARR